jgi:biopolymer transport protein ExbD
MIYKTSLLSLIILFIVIGCSNSSQKDKPDVDKTASEQKKMANDSNVIKVYIEENGVITADGNTLSLKDLDAALSKLKISNGTVYYSRANIEGDPPPESMKVMDILVKYGLPVRLYTDKTFSVPVK